MYHLLETLLANTTTLSLVIVLGVVLLTRWREKEVIRTFPSAQRYNIFSRYANKILIFK